MYYLPYDWLNCNYTGFSYLSPRVTAVYVSYSHLSFLFAQNHMGCGTYWLLVLFALGIATFTLYWVSMSGRTC